MSILNFLKKNKLFVLRSVYNSQVSDCAAECLVWRDRAKLLLSYYQKEKKIAAEILSEAFDVSAVYDDKEKCYTIKFIPKEDILKCVSPQNDSYIEKKFGQLVTQKLLERKGSIYDTMLFAELQKEGVV